MTGAYRALVVDDESTAREAALIALSEEGFQCEWATDGEEAAATLDRRQFDVVVTDLKMPRRNGHSLAVELASRSFPRPLVVVLTGLMEPRLVKDLIARGVDDVTFKPADLGVLGAKIKALCERHRTQEAVSVSLQDKEVTSAPTSLRAEEIQSRLNQVAESFPVFPAARRTANLIQEKAHSPAQVAQALACDPLLVAQVLRLANSASAQPAGQLIDNLQQAVTAVGDRQICELALTSKTLDSLIKPVLPWANPDILWRRCLASGLAIKQLQPSTQIGADDESLFIAALLLPLSRVLLGLALPNLYSNLVAECQRGEFSLPSLERRSLPLTPARATAVILTRWKLPTRLYKPIQHCGLAFNELTSLTGPVRSRVELLKIAEFLGQIAVGQLEPWHEIDLPPFETICRLKLDDVSVITEQIRTDLTQFLAHIASDQIESSANRDHERLMPTVRYYKLSTDFRDPFAALLQSIGFAIEPVSRADACQAKSALINCLDVSPERLQWFLDDALPESTFCLVSNSPLPKHCNSWGTFIQLPSSVQTLTAAIEAIAISPPADH